MYLGWKKGLSELENQINRLREKKEDFIQVFSECKYLSKKNKELAKAYLSSFFEEMDYRYEKGLDMNQSLIGVDISK